VFFKAELICRGAMFFNNRCFVEMWLSRNGVLVEETFGCDRYLFDGTLLPGKRVSGTGRTYIHTRCGKTPAPPGIPVDCSLDLYDDLVLYVKSNLTLDAGVFSKLFSVYLEIGNMSFYVFSDTDDVEVEWTGRGEFGICLESYFVRALANTFIQ
jgi:hypothetical protein